MNYDLKQLKELLNTTVTTEPNGTLSTGLRSSTGELLNLAGLVAVAEQLESVNKSLSGIDRSLAKIAARS